MANPPNVAPQNGNFAAQVTLPEHATVMRRLYVSCQDYASQGKSFKARGITVLFLAAVPFTAAKYLLQAPLCMVWDFVCLRNGFNSFGTKIAELTHCVVFGLLQTAYLWCNAYQHIQAIRATQQQIDQLNGQVHQQGDAIRQKEVQITHLNAHIRTIQGEVDDMQSSLDNMDRLLTEQEARVEALKHVESQLALKEAALSTAQDRIKSLEEQMGQLADPNLIRDKQTEIDRLKAQQDKDQIEINRLKNEVKDRLEKMVIIDLELQKLQKSFASKEAAHEALTKLNVEHVQELIGKQKAIEELTALQASTQAGLAGANGELDKRNAKVKELEKHVTNLSAEAKELEGKVEGLNKERADLNIRLNSANEVARKLKEHCSELETKLVQKQKELLSAEDERKKIQSEKEITFEALSRFKSRLDSLESKKVELETNLKEQAAKSKEEGEQHKKLIADLQAAREELKTQEQTARDALDYSSRQLAQETRRREELEKTLKATANAKEELERIAHSGAPSLPVEPIESANPLLDNQFLLLGNNDDDELFSAEDLKAYSHYQNLIDAKWSVSPLRALISLGTYAFTTAYNAVSEGVFNIAWDKRAQWKLHRYALSTKHHQAFLKFYTDLQNRFSQRKGVEAEIINLFGEAYKQLEKMKKEGIDARQSHQAFVQLMRPPLEKLFLANGELSRDFFDFVINNMDKRFSETYINTFYRKLVGWMSSMGNPKIAEKLVGATLSQKLHLVHEGIKAAPQDIKSPTGHIKWKKMDGVKTNFDPLGDTNHPSIMGTAKYQDANGRFKEVKLMRTGVPVCGRKTPQNGQDKYWELEDVALAPEYLAHCHQLMNQKKNMLVILHLDPARLTELDEKREPVSKIAYVQQPDLALKFREALWINLFRKLGRKFENKINVCVFPLDGEWIHKMEKPGTQTKFEYILALKQFLLANNSPFKLPSFVFALDDTKNPNKKTAEEHNLINAVVNEVSDTYFKDVEKFEANDRKAFLTLFYSRMAEHLRFKHDIAFEQRNCKDAVDRTEGIAGVHLADLNNRLNLLQNSDVQDKIIAETEGPALAYVKREVLKSRESYAAAGMHHLETRLGLTPPPIDGYRLVGFDFHEDETQTLTPDGTPPGSPPRLRRSTSPLDSNSPPPPQD